MKSLENLLQDKKFTDRKRIYPAMLEITELRDFFSKSNIKA